MGSGGAEERIIRVEPMTFAGGAGLVIAGSLVRAAVMPAGSPVAMTAGWLIVLGGVGLSRRLSRPWPEVVCALSTVVAGGLVASTSGALTGGWFVLAALATWGLGRLYERAPRSHRVLGRWLVGVWAGGILSIVFALRTAGGRSVLIPVAMVVVIVGAEVLRPGMLDRFVDAGVTALSRAISALLFLGLGLVALLFAFGGPLSAPSRWRPVDHRLVLNRSWTGGRASGGGRAEQRSRFRWASAVLALIALAGGAALLSGRWRQPSTANNGLSLSDVAARNAGRGGTWWEEPDTTPAAYSGLDWYEGYKADSEWVMNQAVAFRPLHATRVADVSTRTINVTDGVRRTWVAPECDCRRVTVWMYGGSTTFGIGQRDEYTIPSMLAKAAWSEGIALDVLNRGMPGDLHWQEADRLAWDLANEPSPDLVLFYDGVNEIWGTGTRRSEAEPDVTEPIAPMTDQFWNELLKAYDSAPPPAPDGAVPPTTSVGEKLSATDVGRLAVDRYRRSLSMSRDIAEARDLPTVWFWQPSRLSRPPVEGEPNDGDLEDDARQITEAAEAGIPDGVVDVTDAFDGVDEPLFSDDVHHNELGAKIMGERILAEIRPLIDAELG